MKLHLNNLFIVVVDELTLNRRSSIMSVRSCCFALLLVFVFITETMAQNYKLPYLPNEIWRCEQGNEDDPLAPNLTHKGKLAFAWDFNWGAGQDDLGKPFIAARDGVVWLTGYTSGTNNEWGYYVIVKYSDGRFGKAAHLSQIFVKKGETIIRGQVIGLVGGTPNWSPHIHWQEQEDGTLNGKSTASGFSEVSRVAPISTIRTVSTQGVPQEDVNYTSANTNLFDAVFTASGGQSAFGQTIEVSEYGWWETWTSDNYSNVYLTHPHTAVEGGTLYHPHILYDPMRGARSAVLLFGGFYDYWEAYGGPNAWYACPLGPEYLKTTGFTYQDLQGGYFIWTGQSVTAHPYPETFGPGAFDYTTQAPGGDLHIERLSTVNGIEIGWSPTASYLFVECYKLHGQSANVGYPYAGAYGPESYAYIHPWYIPGSNPLNYYLVQNFHGGTYGDCIMMYDPDNWGKVYNGEHKPGTNKAHLIKEPFWVHYRDQDGIHILGCPISEACVDNGVLRQDFQLGYFMLENGQPQIHQWEGIASGSGYLAIASSPSGASVKINDVEPYPGAITPTQLIAEFPGTVHISLNLDGASATGDANVTAGQITETSFTMPDPPPSPLTAPHNLWSPSVGYNFVELQWSDDFNTSWNTSYKVYRNSALVGSTGAGPDFRHFEDCSGIQSSTTYTYYVTAYQNGSESGPSNQIQVITGAQPNDFPKTLNAYNDFEHGWGYRVPGEDAWVMQDANRAIFTLNEITIPQAGTVRIDVEAKRDPSIGQVVKLQTQLAGPVSPPQTVTSTNWSVYTFYCKQNPWMGDLYLKIADDSEPNMGTYLAVRNTTLSYTDPPPYTVTPALHDFGAADTTVLVTIVPETDGWLSPTITASSARITWTSLYWTTDSVCVRVTLHRNAMSPGNYSDTLKVSPNVSTMQKAIFTSSVPYPPELEVSPSNIIIADNDTLGSFSVSNGGGQILTWQCGSSHTAVTPDPTSGEESALIEVDLDRSQRQAGTYIDTVTVTGNGGTQDVLVNYTVPISNHLINGGFETDWASWTVTNAYGKAIKTSGAKEGSKYAEINAWNRSNVTLTQSGFTVTGGTVYTLSLWAQNSFNYRTITVSLVNTATGAVLASRVITLTWNWAQYNTTLTPNASAANTTFKIVFPRYTTSLDGIDLRRQLAKAIGSEPETEMATQPKTYALYQNHPNPFNPTTTFRFDLPEQAHVRLTVHNIIGQRKVAVIDGVMDAGAHSIVWDASQLPSGVYFYTLEAGSFVETKKLVLLK